MKFFLIRINSYIKKVPLFFKSLWKLYKHGGFTSVNISYLNFGEVLNGKNILITGGSTGIGFHIAKKCISEGATVVITGRNDNKLIHAKELINNERLKTLVWDVRNVEIIDEQLSNAERLLKGKIDILVNNAGIVNGTQFLDVTEKIWDDIYSINSKGPFFITKLLCTRWLEDKNNNIKKIINISSQGGFVGATYPYRMTKWDLAGLTQGLGIKFAPYGIIVNGIAPGIIATGMQPGYLNQKNNLYCNQNPAERFALPEEIAELALFLMSDASNFIVGQTILCDGGYSIK